MFVEALFTHPHAREHCLRLDSVYEAPAFVVASEEYHTREVNVKMNSKNKNKKKLKDKKSGGKLLVGDGDEDGSGASSAEEKSLSDSDNSAATDAVNNTNNKVYQRILWFVDLFVWVTN